MINCECINFIKEKEKNHKTILSVIEQHYQKRTNKIVNIMERMEEIYDAYVYEMDMLLDEMKNIIKEG